jgi:archaellum component FlaC
MYDNYKAAGKNTMADGLKNATATQRQMLSQLQTKLNLLGSQISGYTGNFNQGLQESQTQSSANIQGIKDYIQEIDVVNNKINSFDSNVENILNDTDIVVLQKNYEYLFWTILAAGTVLVAMNIVKKTNT